MEKQSILNNSVYRNYSLSDATTPGQSGPWSDSNKGVLRIL